MRVALLDACVLYPPAVRDALLWLAVEGVYSPRWTDAIHEEWIGSVLKHRPDLSRTQLERTRRLMDQIDPLCLVSDYERYIGDIALPDSDDRHVVAAAIVAKASVIVTFNLADFPDKSLNHYGIRALHPDVFLCSLLDE